MANFATAINIAVQIEILIDMVYTEKKNAQNTGVHQ